MKKNFYIKGLKSRSIFFLKAFLPLFCMLAAAGCHKRMINLTPDVIRQYGLDQMTLPDVQLYYRATTVHADSTVTHDEPTVFRRIRSGNVTVTEAQSPAGQYRLDKDGIIIIRDKTPCRIVDVLDSGRVLQADFGDLRLNFELSYKTGYNFILVSDTVQYRGNDYIRSHVPLMQNTGMLRVDRRNLEKLLESKIRIPGKLVENKAVY